MKNKRLLYVLLPAVLAIWGLIFQRIWSAVEGETEPVEQERGGAAPEIRRATSHKLPKLLLNYSDPFSGMVVKPHHILVKSANSSDEFTRPTSPPANNFPIAPAPVAAPAIVWPSLKYVGFINNPKQNSRIAILIINDKEAMLKPGEQVGGIAVARISRDSVQVMFQQKKKIITRTTQ